MFSCLRMSFLQVVSLLGEVGGLVGLEFHLEGHGALEELEDLAGLRDTGVGGEEGVFST